MIALPLMFLICCSSAGAPGNHPPFNRPRLKLQDTSVLNEGRGSDAVASLQQVCSVLAGWKDILWFCMIHDSSDNVLPVVGYALVYILYTRFSCSLVVLVYT
jgi:hypothetical protein